MYGCLPLKVSPVSPTGGSSVCFMLQALDRDQNLDQKLEAEVLLAHFETEGSWDGPQCLAVTPLMDKPIENGRIPTKVAMSVVHSKESLKNYHDTAIHSILKWTSQLLSPCPS